MNSAQYRDHLRSKGIPGNAAEERLRVAAAMEEHFSGLDIRDPSIDWKEKAYGYARRLIAEKGNTIETFSALRDYAGWLGAQALHVAWIEIMDCHNALEKLAGEIEKRHGKRLRDSIFREAFPPLGADEKERCAYTKNITERMAERLSAEESGRAWFQVQHGIPEESWRRHDSGEREEYSHCGSVDEYLQRKRQERNGMLARLRDEGALWYTMEITDEVLDFIVSDPAMEVGERTGNRIVITKVPYNPTRYLHETDARMKRYYACHCPLAREAILRGEPLSPEICHCSLGHASHYLTGLGMELKREVLESAVKGDGRCSFAFYLPEGFGNR